MKVDFRSDVNWTLAGHAFQIMNLNYNIWTKYDLNTLGPKNMKKKRLLLEYCGNLHCARMAKITVEVILMLVEEMFKIVSLN